MTLLYPVAYILLVVFMIYVQPAVLLGLVGVPRLFSERFFAPEQVPILMLLILFALYNFEAVRRAERAMIVNLHAIKPMTIFISYRRDDTAGFAGRIYDRLAGAFPSAEIFMDVDALAPGMDFVAQIDKQIAACDVFLAVIGRRWLESKGGERRIDSQDDYVRLELEAALRREIRVIPVLVDDAVPPSARELPESLKLLSRRHALQLSHGRFGADVQALVNALKER
jgi:hypothetical protein